MGERAELLTRLTAERQRVAGGVARATAIGAIDAVIDPGQTARCVAAVMAAAPRRRGSHGNIPL